jgi:hypothetical protein
MRSTSAVVLFLVVCANALAAHAGEPGRERPQPNVTAAMSEDEVRTVLTFDDLVVATAAELGLARAPSVIYAPLGTRFPFRVDRSKVAFVYPGYNTIVLTDRAVGRPDHQLRCYARHELLHIYLGHTTGSQSQEEQDEKHRQVAAEQRARWNEDSRCE